jgi:hypothetical protein
LNGSYFYDKFLPNDEQLQGLEKKTGDYVLGLRQIYTTNLTNAIAQEICKVVRAEQSPDTMKCAVRGFLSA